MDNKYTTIYQVPEGIKYLPGMKLKDEWIISNSPMQGSDKEFYLDNIRKFDEIMKDAKNQRDLLMLEARAHGVSYTDISIAIGTTRQNARAIALHLKAVHDG